MKNWYSASLVFAIINERDGLWRRVTSVVLIRAEDWDPALYLACEVGRSMEENYVNPEGERVRWALERVATLDQLPEELTSGVEVYSMPQEREFGSGIEFDTEFNPESSYPEQTGISPA